MICPRCHFIGREGSTCCLNCGYVLPPDADRSNGTQSTSGAFHAPGGFDSAPGRNAPGEAEPVLRGAAADSSTNRGRSAPGFVPASPDLGGTAGCGDPVRACPGGSTPANPAAASGWSRAAAKVPPNRANGGGGGSGIGGGGRPPRRNKWALPLGLFLVILILGGAALWYFVSRGIDEGAADTSLRHSHSRETAPTAPEAVRPTEDPTAATWEPGPITEDPSGRTEDELTFEKLFTDPLFRLADPELRAELVSKALDFLAKIGSIESVYQYLEEEKLFLFTFIDGIRGGVCLDDFDFLFGDTYSPEPLPALETTDDPYYGAIFNGFEATDYRRNFYVDMQSACRDQNGELRLQVDLTLNDLKHLDDYDFAVLSMHGFHYNGEPALSLEEPVTASTDLAYSKELREQGTVAKVYCADGNYHYWVLPSFFRATYGSDGLDGMILFSESCCFYGCDCTSTLPDYTMANALLSCGASAVVGYHNSVGADYSRELIQQIVLRLLRGETVGSSFRAAKEVIGSDDGWEDPGDHKWTAYPILVGDENTGLRHRAA